MKDKRATITVEEVPIKTYVWEKPSRYPPFLQTKGWKGSLYPYTMQDKLLHRGEKVRYVQITLENDYVRVTILPGLGGHLWSACDKVSGKEMFYNNRVVKPGLVALRGAWWASGIEWNFPKGHSVSTVSPVDYTTRENADGSVTAVVGDVDRITRMRWTVKITVHPRRTGFALETVLSNPTVYPYRYMYWENCAMHVTEGFQFIAPAKSAWTWGGARKFPVSDGVDQSWYKEHLRAVDFFALGSGQDYFGYYDHERRFGAAHVADCREMPGKKFFTWGTAEHARMWEKNLTDNDGPYIELQCGLAYTQAQHDFFAPLGSRQWDEVWYPVGSLGHFAYANRRAALHLSDLLQGDEPPAEVGVGVITTERHSKAEVAVSSNGRRLLRERNVRFRPGVPRRWKVKPPAGGAEMSVEVSAGGETILRYSTADHNRIKDVDVSGLKRAMWPKVTGSAGSYAAAAAWAVKQLDFGKALDLAGKALKKNGKFTPAHYWKGNVLFKLLKFSQAARHLRKVGPRSEYFELAQSLLAEMARFGGRTKQALQIAGKLGKRRAGAHLGNVLAGKALLTAGDAAGAAEHLAAATRSRKAAPHTIALLAAALRRAGKKARSLAQARRALEIDPLNFLALNECELLGETAGRDRIMRSEEESYLELAAYYEDVSLYEEAAGVLEHYRTHVAPGECGALVYYHLGWINGKLGRAAERDAFSKRAAACDPDGIFAFRREDTLALEAAIEADGSDAVAQCLLGTFLAWRFRFDDAFRLWKRALRGLGDYPVLLRNIGQYHSAVSGNYRQAEKFYARAVDAAPLDEELYAEADELYGKSGRLTDRIRLLERGGRELPESQNVHKLLARSYYFAGRYDDALDCLMARNYDHWENDRLVYHVYVNSHLERGSLLLKKKDFAKALDAFSSAMKFPKNLNVGKPAYPRHAPLLYLSGVACEEQGEHKKALARWRQGADEAHHGWDGGICHEGYYKALCLAKVGRVQEARAHWRRLTKGSARKFQGPAHEQFLMGLGHQGLENWDKAVKHFEASLAGDKTNRNVKYHLNLAKKQGQAGA